MTHDSAPPPPARFTAFAAYASVALVFLQGPWVFAGFIIAWAVEGGELRPAHRAHPLLMVGILTAPLILATLLGALSLATRRPGRHRGMALVGLGVGLFGIVLVGSLWLKM